MNAGIRVTERLEAGETVILDGGMGSELEARGVPMDRGAWCGLANIDHVGTIQQIHEDNIRAGAEVVIANTYALSWILMRGAGAEDRFEEAMRNAVEVAKAARDATGRPEVAIAGSISQGVGRDFMFDDRPPLEGQSFRDAYLEQAQMLAAGGVDMLVLEMMTSPRHAPIVDASLTAGLPVWLGISVLLSPEGDLVTYEHGVSVDDLLEALVRPELAAVNVMHSPLEATSLALKKVRKHWNGPLGAYPESGTWEPPNWTPSTLTPAAFAATAAGWVRDDDVRIIGGCCGIGPQFIGALRMRSLSGTDRWAGCSREER